MSGDAVSKSHKHHWHKLWKLVLIVILLTILAVLFLPSSGVFVKASRTASSVSERALKYPLAVNVCCNGDVHECKLFENIPAGYTIESLKELVSDIVPIKYHPFKLYTQEGLLLRNLNSVGNNFSNIFYVANRRHWMWPPTKIGHVIFPKYVHEDEVNDENNLLQPNSRGNINKEVGVSMKTLSLSPKVFLIENFLSEDEIEYLVNYGKKHLAPSHVGIGKEVVNEEFRTSKTAWDTRSRLSIKIQRRAFALARIPFKKNIHMTDAIQIVRYEEHNMFRLHTDYFKTGYSNLDSSKPEGTNRYITLFMYLNDGFVEGKQSFHIPDRICQDPSLKTTLWKWSRILTSEETKAKMPSCMDGVALAVKPKKGSAVLFYNQLHDGKLDINSEHGGCPIASGVKYGANVWIWNANRPKFN